jgi:hypothetical protein
MTPELFDHSLLSIISYHDAWRDAGDISEWAWPRRRYHWILRGYNQPPQLVLLRYFYAVLYSSHCTRASPTRCFLFLLLSITCFSLGKRLDSQLYFLFLPLYTFLAYLTRVETFLAPEQLAWWSSSTSVPLLYFECCRRNCTYLTTSHSLTPPSSFTKAHCNAIYVKPQSRQRR